MSRPTITVASIHQDRKYADGRRTADISAGMQCVKIYAAELSEGDRAGLHLDISWADEHYPMAVTVNPDHVVVATHHFDQHTEGKQPLRAGDVVRCLAEVQALLDGKEWDSDTLAHVADAVRRAGLLVREPGELDGGES
jgi:hypothetical protein